MPADLLSDAKIRAAKARERAYKLADGLGLYVLVSPNGSRLWRLKYRLGGVERTFAIGAYPGVSLREAWVERDRVRAMVRAGQDPVAERRERREAKQAEALTFRRLFEDWHARYTHTGRCPITERLG